MLIGRYVFHSTWRHTNISGIVENKTHDVDIAVRRIASRFRRYPSLKPAWYSYRGSIDKETSSFTSAPTSSASFIIHSVFKDIAHLISADNIHISHPSYHPQHVAGNTYDLSSSQTHGQHTHTQVNPTNADPARCNPIQPGPTRRHPPLPDSTLLHPTHPGPTRPNTIFYKFALCLFHTAVKPENL